MNAARGVSRKKARRVSTRTTVFYAFCAFKKNPKRKPELKRDRQRAKERVRKRELSCPCRGRRRSRKRPPEIRGGGERAREAAPPSGAFSRGRMSSREYRNRAKTNVLTRNLPPPPPPSWPAFAREEKARPSKRQKRARGVSVTPTRRFPSQKQRPAAPLSLSFAGARG